MDRGAERGGKQKKKAGYMQVPTLLGCVIITCCMQRLTKHLKLRMGLDLDGRFSEESPQIA